MSDKHSSDISSEQSERLSDETANDLSLNQFLAKYPVPCFAQVTRPNQHREVIYLYKQFTSNCLLAKSYSNLLENYLLHHRPSYVPSEAEFGASGGSANDWGASVERCAQNTLMSNKFVFNDIITIPFDYPGEPRGLRKIKFWSILFV